MDIQKIIESSVKLDPNMIGKNFHGPDDGVKWLLDYRDGNIQKGFSYCASLDDYWKFKLNQYEMYLGKRNVGKTTFILWLYYRVCMNYKEKKFKFILFIFENNIHAVKRIIIQFYWKNYLSKLSHEQIKEGNDWFNEHFLVVKNSERFYLQEVLDISKKLNDKKEYHGIFIDPYNRLRIDQSERLNGYLYHQEMSSRMMQFAHNEIGVTLSAHPYTAESRNKTDKMPMLDDCEGGNLFTGPLDNGAVIHRVMKDEAQQNITLFGVDKIKETDTGGKWTSYESPIQFKMQYQTFIALDGKDKIKVQQNTGFDEDEIPPF